MLVVFIWWLFYACRTMGYEYVCTHALFLSEADDWPTVGQGPYGDGVGNDSQPTWKQRIMRSLGLVQEKEEGGHSAWITKEFVSGWKSKDCKKAQCSDSCEGNAQMHHLREPMSLWPHRTAMDLCGFDTPWWARGSWAFWICFQNPAGRF